MEVEPRNNRGVANVRRFRAEDAKAVTAIAEESPEAAIWSKESYVKFGEENGSLALVVETDGEITGFLIGRKVEDQAEILNVAVAPKHKRKGAGAALLTAALAEFKGGAVKNVYLEVRESNTGAIAFYEKQGFSKMGYRNGYYRNPDEPAITMQKKLTG